MKKAIGILSVIAGAAQLAAGVLAVVTACRRRKIR
jgi:hypothetical protein